MKSSLKLLTSVIIVSSLAACSATSTKTALDTRRADNQASLEVPAWVNNPPQRTGFAYGTGSSDLWGDKGDAA